MKLDDRLKKIEMKAPEQRNIIVVKFSNEIWELFCAGETFARLEYESEDGFIERIKKIVERKQQICGCPTILVSGF